MSMYAKDTSVSVERSRTEIEAVLGRYGASRFAYATEEGRAMIGFAIKDVTGTHLAIRMTLPLPKKSDNRFARRKKYSQTIDTTPEEQHKLWEQACRSAWRSLALVIKAKLEACASGISTVEREFLADVMTPSGQTIGEHIRPQLQAMSEKGETPRLLLTGS